MVVLPLLAAIFVLTPAAVAQAAQTWDVTTTSDPAGAGNCDNMGGTPCSLRQAVGVAQDGDTISVPAGSYSVSLGTIPISHSITIAGAAVATTTIDGSGNSSQGSSGRILRVDSGTVAIQDLTLTHGDDSNDENCCGGPTVSLNGGGALFNAGGSVSLARVAFTNNFSLIGGAAAPTGT